MLGAGRGGFWVGRSRLICFGGWSYSDLGLERRRCEYFSFAFWGELGSAFFAETNGVFIGWCRRSCFFFRGIVGGGLFRY